MVIEDSIKQEVSYKELRELKSIIIWFIEGYKYYYLRDNEEIVRASSKIIEYLKDHLLFEDEKKKYKLLDNKETADSDTSRLKELFDGCDALNETNILPRLAYKEFKEIFLTTDEDFEYTDEYNDFTKLMLAAGALEFHKKKIEKITGKKITIIEDKPIDINQLEKDSLDLVLTILNNDKIGMALKSNYITSIDYINNYQLMMNDKIKSTEYSDEIDAKELKYKL